MKRKDECLFCNSRKCYTQIYREADEMGPAYNEIACSKHVEELGKHSDEVLGSHNGVMRVYVSSSSRLTRNNKPSEEVYDNAQ